MIGPKETRAIWGRKWLAKLNEHLQAFPGERMPWSDGDLPGWCIQGYDLVVAFNDQASSSGYQEGQWPKDDPQLLTYRTQRRQINPFVAALATRHEVEEKVRQWSNGIRPYKNAHNRNQIDIAIDRVVTGSAKGDWISVSDVAQDMMNKVEDTPLHELLSMMPPDMAEKVLQMGGGTSEADQDRLLEEIMRGLDQSKKDRILGQLDRKFAA